MSAKLPKHQAQPDANAGADAGASPFASAPASGAPAPDTTVEWFAQPPAPPAPDAPHTPDAAPGLRFSCTSCGNCCSGPAGYVLVSDDERRAIAEHLRLDLDTFTNDYTHTMPLGRSLNERPGPRGYDCVFLDRDTAPGKALCRVYAHRPAQCRTWPFWPSVLRSRDTWTRAAQTCPGINHGTLVPVEEVRIRRDTISI
jgi:Fe-S-cluster containining protein